MNHTHTERERDADRPSALPPPRIIALLFRVLCGRWTVLNGSWAAGGKKGMVRRPLAKRGRLTSHGAKGARRLNGPAALDAT